jgi:hypothetical protein
MRWIGTISIVNTYYRSSGAREVDVEGEDIVNNRIARQWK